jgi:hypothetical protein
LEATRSIEVQRRATLGGSPLPRGPLDDEIVGRSCRNLTPLRPP